MLPKASSRALMHVLYHTTCALVDRGPMHLKVILTKNLVTRVATDNDNGYNIIVIVSWNCSILICACPYMNYIHIIRIMWPKCIVSCQSCVLYTGCIRVVESPAFN